MLAPNMKLKLTKEPVTSIAYANDAPEWVLRCADSNLPATRSVAFQVDSMEGYGEEIEEDDWVLARVSGTQPAFY